MKIGSLSLFEKKYIGGWGDKEPLLIRHILIRCPLFGIYLHQFLRSDYDRALHDHPWPFITVMLKNGYVEVHDQTLDNKETRLVRKPFNISYRPAKWRHRVEIDPEHKPWTLVFVGHRQRKWGFWINNKWCWWRKHNPELNICSDEVLWHDFKD